MAAAIILGLGVGAALAGISVREDLRDAEARVLADGHQYELQVMQRFAVARAMADAMGGEVPIAAGFDDLDRAIASHKVTDAYPFVAAVAWAAIGADGIAVTDVHPPAPHGDMLRGGDSGAHPKLVEAIEQAVDWGVTVGSDMIVGPDGALGFVMAKAITPAGDGDARNAVALFIDAETFFQTDAPTIDHISVWLLDLDAAPGEARPLYLIQRPAADSPFETIKIPLNIETAERTFWISAESNPQMSDISIPSAVLPIALPMLVAFATLILIAKARMARWRIDASDGRLTQLEQRFKDFAEASVDAFWEMDANLRFSYFSDSFEQVTGVPPDAMLGKTRQETGIPDVDPIAWKEHLAALDERQPFRDFIHPRTKPDGGKVWVAVSGQPIFDQDGAFQGFRGTCRDITDHVAREGEKLAAVEAAADAAEAANRQKTDFLAKMSHELRTPLNAVIGFSQILSQNGDKVSPADRQEYIEHVRESGEHLLSLVNDILDITKIETGKEILVPETFPAHVIGELITSMFAPQAAREKIDFRCDLDVGDALLHADRRRLSQALINLVSNAIKFTPEGGSVTLSGRLAPSGAHVFTVTDTGIGLAPDQVETAFSTFGQVDSGLSRQYGGVGLGLPLVKLLTELHGGEITVESDLGAGAAFTIALPPERTILEEARRSA